MGNSNYMVNRAYKKYLIPTMISSVSPYICASIDKVIVGNMLGQNALASVGLAMPLTVLLSALTWLFSLGGSNLCILYNSRGEVKNSHHTFSVSMLATLAITLVCTILGLLYLNPLVRLLGADALLFENTRKYVMILLIGFPIMILCMSMDFFLRVDGAPHIIVAGMLLANITNILLDFIFIKSGMGVAGSALASVIGYTVSLLLYIVYFVSEKCSLHIAIKAGKCINTVKEILQIGFGTVIAYLGWFFSMIIINQQLANLGGAASVSIYAVVQNIIVISVSLYDGAVSAVMPIAGTFYGDRDYLNMRKVLINGISVAYLLGGTMVAAYWVFPEFFVHLFGVTDGKMLFENSKALRIASLGVLFQIMTNILYSFFQMTGKQKLVTISSFLGSVILQPIFPLLFSAFWGINGVYISLVWTEIAQLLLILAAIIWYQQTHPNVKGVLLLEHVEKGREFTYSLKGDIASMEEVLRAIQIFCQEENIDKKRGYVIGLSIEEMSRNIIEHGLAKEKKPHYIDIRIKINQNKVVIRIRDDGEIFDPVHVDFGGTAKENIEAGEPMHLGIRLVKGMAQKIEYTRVIGFNNLVIYIE